MQENQRQVDQIIQTITTGKTDGALVGFLSERAEEIKAVRDHLQLEQRRLVETLAPLEQNFDAAGFQAMLGDFYELYQDAEPEEVQRLMRLIVRRIDWMPNGRHRVQYYHAPARATPKKPALAKWWRRVG